MISSIFMYLNHNHDPEENRGVIAADELHNPRGDHNQTTEVNNRKDWINHDDI